MSGLRKLSAHKAVEHARPRDAFERGDRVELVRCSDPYTRLVPGDRGKVLMVDAVGTVHVDWDNGSNLGMIAEDGDLIKRVSS